jgi:hypothetical protein
MMKPMQLTKTTGRFVTGVGVAALLAVAPQIAHAATSAATSVDLRSVQLTPDMMSDYGEPGVVRLAFDDAGPVAADEIVFQVVDPDGAIVTQFADKGSFAPGVTIVHTFDVGDVQSNDSVQVAEVKYADGSVWKADGGYIEGKQQRLSLSTGE